MLQNVKSLTSTYLQLDYVIVHNQFNHQKKWLCKNFLEQSDIFSVEVSSLLNKDYDQPKVDFHILKMYMVNSGRGVFFLKNPLLRAITSMSSTNKVSELLFH